MSRFEEKEKKLGFLRVNNLETIETELSNFFSLFYYIFLQSSEI